MDNNEIVWWQSRTVWAGIIGTLFACLSALGWLPQDLTSNQVVDAILAVTSIAAIIFRVKAKSPIAPLTPPGA